WGVAPCRSRATSTPPLPRFRSPVGSCWPGASRWSEYPPDCRATRSPSCAAEDSRHMRISMFGQLKDAGDQSAIDYVIATLTQWRDEGFRRAWISQLPYEPNLLTILAIALREVDGIEVGSGVVPIQNQHPMQMAQRALTVNLAGDGRFLLGL